MFASIFQLSGAILLGYLIAFRKKKQVIISSSTSIFIEGEKPRIAEDKWVETYGYRFGFLYLLIGYILPVFERKFMITVAEELFLIILLVSILLIAGIGFSSILGKRAFDKMTPQDFYEGSPPGAVMFSVVDEKDNSIGK
ncbi:hypothetical protein [Sporosarcina sp. UB5]|uniref:hypothetical protein n=1 Tax=Sporosarcina sp. UB5 TaxID=3047463 RepID=UPI003D790F64